MTPSNIIPIDQKFSVLVSPSNTVYLIHAGCDFKWTKDAPYCFKASFYRSDIWESSGRYNKPFNCGKCPWTKEIQAKFNFIARTLL